VLTRIGRHRTELVHFGLRATAELLDVHRPAVCRTGVTTRSGPGAVRQPRPLHRV
jgi:hypothetical protein